MKPLKFNFATQISVSKFSLQVRYMTYIIKISLIQVMVNDLLESRRKRIGRKYQKTVVKKI